VAIDKTVEAMNRWAEGRKGEEKRREKEKTKTMVRV
jgi:hypothetical protein